jgi:hypothetical protein
MFSVLTLTAGKIALGVLVAGAAVGGGAGVAAYTGTLPAAAQQAAHDVIGAPLPKTNGTASPTADPTSEPTASTTASPSATASAKSTPVGPDATGPAAFGLCTAFAQGLNVSSTAYASLVSAANGASNIATYCATIPAPGQSASHPQHTANPVPPADSSESKAPKPVLPGVAQKPVLGTQP